jgi:sucrose synthase
MAGGGFSRSDSIADMMPEALRRSRYHMKRCFQRYVARGSGLMKRQQLLEELHRSADDKLDDIADEGLLGYVISSTHEAVVLPPHVNFAVRTNPGIWEYIKVHSGDLTVEQITPSQYLKCKEILHDHQW